MDIRVIQNIDEIDSLSYEWNQLLSVSSQYVPFLHTEFVKAWWQYLGGGEWDKGDLYIVIAEENSAAGKRLVGIAPLFITQNRQGKSLLMLVGSLEISDYLDVIVAPEDNVRFIKALFEHLYMLPNNVWQEMHWYNLIEGSPTLPAFINIAESLGWKVEQERLQPAPYIPLCADWDAYLSTVNKKQRHEIRRKMHRFEFLPQEKRWYIVEDESKLDEELEAFFALMVMDDYKAAFLTEQMRKQMERIARAAFKQGWLQLAFLEVDGKKAAAYINFDYANQIWLYNSGLNPDFASLSPGWVLLGYLIQWAIVQQRSSFDFMRGEETYKTRFGSLNRYVARASAYR